LVAFKARARLSWLRGTVLFLLMFLGAVSVHGQDTILDGFTALVSNKQLKNDYNNYHQKYLYGLSIGGGNLVISGAMEVLFDMDDFFGISPKGQAGWVTVYVAAQVDVASITPEKFVPSTEANFLLANFTYKDDLADPDFATTVSLFNYTEISTLSAREFHYPGVKFPDLITLGSDSFEIGFFDEQVQILKFEVKIPALKAALSSSVPTSNGLVSSSSVGPGVWQAILALYQSSDARPASMDDGTAEVTASNAPTVSPSITLQPQNQVAVIGQNTTFTAAASGTPAPTYQWQLSSDGGESWSNVLETSNFSGTATDTLQINAAAFMDGYQFRCAATNGASPDAISNPATLTVLATAPTEGSDPYEPNDTSTQATPLTPGTPLTAYISSPTDVDWYKVNVTTPGTLTFNLTVPPDKDYDLEFYGPDGTFIAGSYNPTGVAEGISYNAMTTGTYYVRVYGYPIGNGAFSTTEGYMLGAGFNSINSVFAPNLYVANEGNSSGSAIYDISPSGVVSTFTTGLAADLTNPAIVFDASGNLFVANLGGTVFKITSSGVVSTFATGLGSQLESLAVDVNGNLFAASEIAGAIYEITPSGIVSTFATGLNNPVGLAFDVGGNLFVANAGNNTISKITPQGVASTFVDNSAGLNEPFGLAFDTSGNLFVVNLDSGTVSKITPAGVVSTFASGLNFPIGLVFDASGNLFVSSFSDPNSDSLSGSVTKITLGGVMSIYASGLSCPFGMAFGPNPEASAIAFAANPNRAIAEGYFDSLFLKSDGSLWGMGYNSDGELGDGTTTQRNVSEQILPSGVTAIAAGVFHSLFLKSDGSLWGMGSNSNGQLGDGTTTNHSRPEQIVASGVTAIAASASFSLFLKSDGSLWAMGYNANGQLGDNTTNDSDIPEQIVPSGVTAIATGYSHSLFLKNDGSLWAMGDNVFGALGDGTTTQHNTPVQIVPNGVTTIAAGSQFSLFIKSDGSLWGMGYGGVGELGASTTNFSTTPKRIVANGVTAIAAGGYHSLFLKSDGSLWAMGDNDYGQLGDGTTTLHNTPEEILPSGVIAIAAGEAFSSLFLKSDGSLWAMGLNSYGELGDGTTTNRLTPEQVGTGVGSVNIEQLSNIQLGGSLFFSNVGTNSTATRTFTIYNTSDATLTIGGITLPSGFSGNWSGGNVAAGGSQSVSVSFSPTAVTSYSGSVTINSNAANVDNGVVTLPVSGTGLSAVDISPPILAITSPTNNTVATGVTVTITGSATDNGNGNNGISSVLVNGNPAIGGTAVNGDTANWSATVSLGAGNNTINVVATDGAGNRAIQQITVDYPIAPVYPAWAIGLGLSGNTALASAIPFTDGLPNLARYAMNIGPLPQAGQLPTVALANISGANYLTLQYRQAKGLTGVQMTPQYSTDLINWVAVPTANIVQMADDDVNTERWAASMAVPSTGSIFLRVQVSQSN